MVDQPLHERLSYLEGWDGMDIEDRFLAARKAGVLDVLNLDGFTYETIVEFAELDKEGPGKLKESEIDAYLERYITDPDELSCGYYLLWDIDQLNSDDVIQLLSEHFPELEIGEDEDFDTWVRAYVRRARLGNLADRGTSTAEPGKM